MARLSIARSLRLALLGLTILLAAVAAGGVAFLYQTRQDYEDRIAADYQLQTAASRLLAAAIVEEATLRTASSKAQLAAAKRAFDITLADARRLAKDDPPSAKLLADAAKNQQRVRERPAATNAPLSGRESIVKLAARQKVRLDQARDDAADDSRTALIAAGIGAALALIAALALVAAMVDSIRKPLERLVEAARKLADGDLSTRVPEEGPQELRELAVAFNTMAADLEKANANLEAERRRLATTVRSLGDGLIIASREGVVEHLNPRATILVPELDLGSKIEGSVLPDLEEALEGEVTLERDGRTLLVTAATLEDHAGTVWTLRDATERVRLEKLKSEFVATASHELRSPLTSIKGFVELLAAGGKLDDRQREFVEIIELSTNRLVDLVNDLLDVARVEAGRIEIHRRPTDIAAAVHEVTTLMGPRIDDKHQTLTVEIADDVPLALADPARVRQILTNLVTNAHLYTPEGGSLYVDLHATPLYIVLAVSDTGRGMTDEEIEHAFDRFYRGSGERQPGGTGLGLAIVRSLVELHGGDVTVDSTPGEGTVFTVRLPIAPHVAEGLPAPRHALRGRRILVVDDEPAIAELIAERLHPYEVQTSIVNSGSEALEQLRSGRFDAITLDILMPGMSGFEVLRTLRADPQLRGIPVVVVSVFSGREALAGEWVVPKPIDADELVDALGQAILAGRVRVLVVARNELRKELEPTLFELGIEYEWAIDPLSAAQMCLDNFFEVALVDVGLHQPDSVMAALDLRGRRLRRSVVLFGVGDESPGLARLDAEPVDIADAGATVLGLLQAEQA